MRNPHEECVTQKGLLKHSAQICRETGKEHMVKVHSGEGVANHPGPEPCGGLREGTDEKAGGGHVGGPLRRDNCSSRAPPPVGERQATSQST